MSEFDDPFDLHRQSQPTGRRTEDGLEIRLVGSPIHGWNPDTNELGAAADFDAHPCVAGRYFYTFPTELLDVLVAELGGGAFDGNLLQLERTFSGLCGDHCDRVGIWQCQPVVYQGLRPTPAPSFSDEQFRTIGMGSS